jgi:N-acetylglutamate synthase-like GNAT family acetyltransferase
VTTATTAATVPVKAPPLADGYAFRGGTLADAPAILRLIDDNLVEGHLLPRTIEDLTAHAGRFVVIARDGRVVGCAELAPLSPAVAEVRSLVVDAAHRGAGLGSALIARLCQRARTAEYSTLCAFTHDPRNFVRLGFSIAPHVWFPEKVALDCVGCPRFRVCGQVAVSLALDGRVLARPRESHSRLPVTPGATRDGAPSHGPRSRYLRVVSR